MDRRSLERSQDFTASSLDDELAVAVLTGGADRPYAYGLAMALISKGVTLHVIGNDDLDCPEFRGKAEVNFLNLRGSQHPGACVATKIGRVLLYYAKLIRYAATAKPRVFHILWNNKFEAFDRTLLMLYYRWLGKKIVFTAHNVNARRRDGNDTWLNRFSLRTQYRLADHIFVHTEQMKQELLEEFPVSDRYVTVIPFGINNAVPITDLTATDARRRLGIGAEEKPILFFGHIAPYKGLEYLVSAFRQALRKRGEYRLIIAGKPKNCESYWSQIRQSLEEEVQSGRILLRTDFIPDEETEVYFKAADVFVLPYKHIYQSGVLFLGQSFGLPALAADVGSLKEEIVEGETGFIFKPEDSVALANAIERYFQSDLYRDLERRRRAIRVHATETHSWDMVARLTMDVYASLRRPMPCPTAVAS
jgi:D-inositol-3-phosphate glycosyltransferase